MSPSQRKPMNGEQLDKLLVRVFGENRQTAFGKAIGVAPRTVRKWVSGEAEVPRHIAVLVNLMIKHHVEPEELQP